MRLSRQAALGCIGTEDIAYTSYCHIMVEMAGTLRLKSRSLGHELIIRRGLGEYKIPLAFKSSPTPTLCQMTANFNGSCAEVESDVAKFKIFYFNCSIQCMVLCRLGGQSKFIFSELPRLHPCLINLECHSAHTFRWCSSSIKTWLGTRCRVTRSIPL